MSNQTRNIDPQVTSEDKLALNLSGLPDNQNVTYITTADNMNSSNQNLGSSDVAYEVTFTDGITMPTKKNIIDEAKSTLKSQQIMRNMKLLDNTRGRLYIVLSTG